MKIPKKPKKPKPGSSYEPQPKKQKMPKTGVKNEPHPKNKFQTQKVTQEKDEPLREPGTYQFQGHETKIIFRATTTTLQHC